MGIRWMKVKTKKRYIRRAEEQAGYYETKILMILGEA